MEDTDTIEKWTIEEWILRTLALIPELLFEGVDMAVNDVRNNPHASYLLAFWFLMPLV
jgi:hypothetical protein